MFGVAMLEQRRVLLELVMADLTFELFLVAVGADVLHKGDFLKKTFPAEVAAEALFFVRLGVSCV